MQRALRPYATAGIAVVGAGLIAVTPVAPPLPDVQVLAVQLTAATDLTPVDLLNDLSAVLSTQTGDVGAPDISDAVAATGLGAAIIAADDALQTDALAGISSLTSDLYYAAIAGSLLVYEPLVQLATGLDGLGLTGTASDAANYAVKEGTDTFLSLFTQVGTLNGDLATQVTDWSAQVEATLADVGLNSMSATAMDPVMDIASLLGTDLAPGLSGLLDVFSL